MKTIHYVTDMGEMTVTECYIDEKWSKKRIPEEEEVIFLIRRYNLEDENGCPIETIYRVYDRRNEDEPLPQCLKTEEEAHQIVEKLYAQRK